MKLTRVALRNVHAHGETDWNPNGSRLVALVGANGTGKSTLASDAIRFALYGELREGPDWLVRLGQTEASVIVEFGYAGGHYRVARLRSTKSGGKSSLELAIADGETWRSLTRDSIRETQQAIVELLRMDAATFDAAVVLSQGRIMALVEGSAAERKRVVGQVLGLEVYERAEAAAREHARDVDARVKADVATADRLEAEVITGSEGLEADLAQGRARLAELEQLLADNAAAGEAAAAQLAAAQAELAGLQAIADQAAALEREKADLRDRWQAERGRLEAATVEIARLEGMRADTAGVDDAIHALPIERSALADLVTVEANDRRLTREIVDMDRAIRDLEIPHSQARIAWETRHTAAVEKVDELLAHERAKTSVCQACGQPINRDTALEQLQAARAAVKALGEQPSEPTSIAIAKAKRARLEANLRDLAWDPAALIAARDRVAALERLAARAETIAAAGASIDRERMRIRELEAELARITERGRAVAASIAELAPKLAGRPALDAAWASARKVAVDLAAARTGLEGERRLVERAVVIREAQQRALADKAAEAEAIRIRVAGDALQLARLRKEIEALGVKGIPARIIAGATPELERHANQLLAELRPGMSMSIESQRAKKSGDGVIEALDLVVRDEVGERPFSMFSGGERMSIALAFAVALSQAAGRRAGAQVGLLVIDEPDGLDIERRRALGAALRGIAHRGERERIVLVSHHPDLAEYADEVYQVSKGPEGSVVSLVM